MPSIEDSNSTIKSVVKAVDILNFLAKCNAGCTFTEISQNLGFHKATTHRFLQMLLQMRLIKYDPNDARYSLGLKLLELGTAAQNQLKIRQILRPFLNELAERTEETTNLAVIEYDEAIFIDNIESPKGLRVFSRIGKPAAFHSTSIGKVLLTFLPDEKRIQYIKKIKFEKHTVNTIIALEDLEKEMSLIRSRGYAMDDEESEIGARCVAAPIRDYSSEVIAAISISGPVSRLPLSEIDKIAAIVLEIAERASKFIGNRAL